MDQNDQQGRIVVLNKGDELCFEWVWTEQYEIQAYCEDFGNDVGRQAIDISQLQSQKPLKHRLVGYEQEPPIAHTATPAQLPLFVAEINSIDFS